MKNFNGYTSTWEIMKKVADPEELKELEAIEKRYQEKPTALNPLGQKLLNKKVNPSSQFVDSKKIVKPKTPNNIGEYYKNKGTPRVTPTVKQPVKPIINTHIPYIDVSYKPYRPDPRDKLAEAEFKKILDDARKEKELEATQGLPGLIPGASKILERSERRIEQIKPITYGGDDNDM